MNLYTHRRSTRFWYVTLALMFSAVAAVWIIGDSPHPAFAADPPSPRVMTGIVALNERLYPSLPPTGSGIFVGHVEGSDKGAYMPHGGQQRFAGVSFVPKSGPSKVSSHAHGTAKVIYGSHGLAPGVRNVMCYDSTDWLTKGYLKVGTNDPPVVDNCRVLTHSWIAEHSPRVVELTLQRVDYVIDHHGVLMVTAVNNGPKTPVPSLISSSYNIITVGRADGRSSGGYTRVDGEGRCKPDIAAPGSLTSFAAPVVTAIVARLLELADTKGRDHPMGKPQTIKAALLAGAHKPEGWKQRGGRPLDERLGAGIVRFDHSYDILRRGPVKPGPIAKDYTRHGWSFANANAREPQTWYLQLSRDASEFSVALVWHRRIETAKVTDKRTGRTYWGTRPALANLDLVLLDETGEVVSESVSEVDNVEHVFRKDLPAGRYEIQVIRRDERDVPWPFALAWRTR